MILIYYVMDFLKSQNYNYLKSPFKHLEIIIRIFFCDISYMSYNIMIWNWKWKKTLFSISFKYSYFKLVLNYIRKGLWKGTLIHQNCDILMCFRPCHTIAMFNDINNIASFECIFCKGCPLGCKVNQGHNPNQFAKKNLGMVIVGDPIIPRISNLTWRFMRL